MSSTQLLIIDSESEALLATLSNSASGRANYYDAYHTEQLNGDNHFEFRMIADHPDSEYVVYGNYVGFKDLDGIIQLFQIYKTEEVSDGSRIYKYVYAEHCSYELLDDIIISVNLQDITAQRAIEEALVNSRWQPGTVVDLGLSFVDYHYDTAISCLQQVANRWGGELQFRVTLSTTGQITGRYVDLLTRRGADTGKRFQFDKDMVSVKRYVNISTLKTALYGRGAAVETSDGGVRRKIDFKDIVWSKAAGDPADKPAGQEWIGDPEALTSYGRINGTKHRFGVFEEGRTTDPATLLSLTWEKLQSLNKPGVTYQTDIINVEEITGLPHDKIRLGDTVQVIDTTFYPPIRAEARIFELKRAIDDPENTSVVLGNFIEMFTNLIEKKLTSLERELADNSGIWDQSGKPIDNGSYPDIAPETPTLIASGGFAKIILEWTAQFDPYMQHYEVYASETPQFAVDPTNLIFRGLVSMYTFNAGTNKQYYFKVRGINRAGRAGDFSNEATATTARILTDDILFGQVTADLLADLAVEAAKLADQAVTPEKIANLAVGTAAIANLAVTKAKIATLAVGTAQIEDLAVTNAKIGDLAVDTAKIADLAVTSAKVSRLSADKITIGMSSVFEDGFNPTDKTELWFYTGTPTLDNQPAVNWGDIATKEIHRRDMYYDLDSGKSYRFMSSSDTPSLSWTQIGAKNWSELA